MWEPQGKGWLSGYLAVWLGVRKLTEQVYRRQEGGGRPVRVGKKGEKTQARVSTEIKQPIYMGISTLFQI